MDYFTLYKIILEASDKPSVTDGQELLNDVVTHSYISELRTRRKDDAIILQIIYVLENCIDEGLIKGKYTATFDENFHRIRGLTTLGHQCLETLSNDSSVNKFKKFLKDSSSKIALDSLGHLLRSYLQ